MNPRSNDVIAPNCIVISVDTLRNDHLGCYGNQIIHSPAFDRIARKGQQFQTVISPLALTVPAHATMLSGLYPAELGCHSNGDSFNSKTVSLMSELEKTGYSTAAIVSGYPLKKAFFHFFSHFDHYDDKFSPDWFPVDEFFDFPPAKLLADRGIIYDRRNLFERRGSYVNSKVISSIETLDEPFFMFIHYYEPHGPYEPPAIYRKYYYPATRDPSKGNSMEGVHFPAYQRLRHIRDREYPLAMYRGEVTYVDTLIGDLLMKSLHILDKKCGLLLITADHGESLDEHDYFFDHGHDCYSPSINVPLLMLNRQQSPVNLITQPVSLAEIKNLVIENLGIHIKRSHKPNNEVLTSHTQLHVEKAFPLEANSNLLRHTDDATQLVLKPYVRGLQYGSYKYYEDLERDISYLFDLEKDPLELQDFSSQYPKLFYQLQSMLHLWEKKVSKIDNHRNNLANQELQRLQELGYINND